MSVKNTGRKFGEANEYIVAIIAGRPALLTDAQAAVGLARAKSQPEDVPRWARWLGRISDWLALDFLK